MPWSSDNRPIIVPPSTESLGKRNHDLRNRSTGVYQQYLPNAGLTLAAITPKIRKRFNLRWGAVGVLVTLIDPEHAQRTVMKRGDVIVQVNQKDVWLPNQVITAYQDAKAAKRDRLLLLVERLGAYEFMLLPVR